MTEEQKLELDSDLTLLSGALVISYINSCSNETIASLNSSANSSSSENTIASLNSNVLSSS